MVATVCTAAVGCDAVRNSEEAPTVAAMPLVPAASLLDDAEAARSEARLGDAKAAYLDILQREPDNRGAMLGLGDTLYELGDLEPALTQYEAVLAGGGSKAQVARARLGIGLIRRREGQLMAARNSLETAVQADPTLWKGWLALGQMHQEAGRMALAEEAYASATGAGADVAVVHNDVGMWYLSRQEPEEAIDAFQRALKLDGTLDLARGNLRLAHAMNRDYASALAGASGPELPEVLNNVGYMALVNGDLDTAQKLLEQSVQISPYYNAPAVANLELLNDLRGRKDSSAS